MRQIIAYMSGISIYEFELISKIIRATSEENNRKG